MAGLRRKLARGGVPGRQAAFACALLDLLEFDDRLPLPRFGRRGTGLWLGWADSDRRLSLRLGRPGLYRYWCYRDGRLLLRGVVRGRDLVQSLRWLCGWLLDDIEVGLGQPPQHDLG